MVYVDVFYCKTPEIFLGVVMGWGGVEEVAGVINKYVKIEKKTEVPFIAWENESH